MIKDKTVINIDLLKEILTLQAPSKEEDKVREYIINKIEKDLKIDCHLEVDKKGNLLVTKGIASLYPCIVSHLDDVHKYDDSKTIHQQNDILFAFNGEKQIGCGGDDKVGMYICLQALIDFDVIKVVFFVEEEIGTIGSNEVDLEFFKDCKFIAQPDRKGNSDLINYTNGTDVMSAEFKEFLTPIIEPYKYSYAHGSCTDVGKLVNRGVGISSFNISCGYYNAHQSTEIVKISEVNICYDLLKTIINKCTKQYTYTKPVYTYTKSFNESDENYLSEVLMEKYEKDNPRIVAQYKNGVKTGIKFVVEILRKCDTNLGQKHIYTLADELEDFLSFQDEEEDLKKDVHSCEDNAFPFYNYTTGGYDYNCKICKKDVTDIVFNTESDIFNS